MKSTLQVAILVFCSACVGYADEAQWPPWYEGDGKNGWTRWAKPVSTSQVELVIAASTNQPPFLAIGVKNIGEPTLNAGTHLWANVFPRGTMLCRTPDGKVLNRRIPPHSGWYWGQVIRVPRGKTYYDDLVSRREVIQWFRPMAADGQYLVWWEWKGKKSNVLTLKRKGKTLRYIPERPYLIAAGKGSGWAYEKMLKAKGVEVRDLIVDKNGMIGVNLSATGISDLSPLKGMPLTWLDLHECPVTDLSALKGMRLTQLDLRECPVTDLSPLKGMPLTSLNLWKCRNVTDVSPLQGMPLKSLVLWSTITDLSPLKGMPLKQLGLAFAAVDISPLKDMTTLTSLFGISHAEILLEAVNEALAANDYAKAEQEARKVIEDWSDVPAMKMDVALARKIVPARKLHDEMEGAFQKQDFRQAQRKANEILKRWPADAQTAVGTERSGYAQVVGYARKATAISMIAAIKLDPNAFPPQTKLFGGHHYSLWLQPMEWNDAKKFCESFEGHLVTITSKEEQKWVDKSFRKPKLDIWLGGYDKKNDGRWTWVTGEPWVYVNAGVYMGKKKWGNTLFMSKEDGTWGGYDPETVWPFIIEWER